MMRTTPRLRTTLHLSHIRLTEALTFMCTSSRLRARSTRACRSLSPPNDPPARPIARTQFDCHVVAHDQPHEIAAETRRRVRHDLAPAANRHPIEHPRQHL